MNSDDLNDMRRRASEVSAVGAEKLGLVEIDQALRDREKLLQAVGELDEMRYLWDGLHLDPNDTVTGAILLAKIANFDRGSTVIAISTTRDLDFITQIGIMRSATLIVESQATELEDDGS